MPNNKTASLLTRIAHLKQQPDAGRGLQNLVAKTYQHQLLNHLEACLNNADIESQNKALCECLAANWRLIQGSFLCYLAQPHSEITLLLCDIAQYAAQHASNKVPAIGLLMPGLALESPNEDLAPNLTTLDLKAVLKTHILGKNGLYLVPVHRLLDAQDAANTKSALCNYYYDVDNAEHQGLAFLCQQDIEQMQTHSAYSKALADTKEAYEQSMEADQGLLFHVRKLMQHLHYNSVQGVGSETNAGEGVYSHIVTFYEYYKELGNEVKSTIPVTTKTEIERLLALISDSGKNPNAANTLETCIAMRRESLNRAVKKDELSLSHIALAETQRQSLTKQRKAQWLQARKEFEQALLQERYEGGDKRGLHRALLTALGLRISITNPQDLTDFMASSASEIFDLCQDRDLPNQIIDQFNNLDAWVMFLHETPVDKLQALLASCAKPSFAKFARSSRDIATLLSSLDTDRMCLILKYYNIINTQELALILKNLSPKQCQTFCENKADELQRLIQAIEDFVYVAKLLHKEQRQILYENFLVRLPGMITTARHLGRVLELLPIEQCRVFYENLESKLQSLIQTPEQLGQMLGMLSSKKIPIIYEKLRSKLQSLIQTREHLSQVLSLLSPNTCHILCSNLGSKLQSLIPTVSCLAEFVADARRYCANAQPIILAVLINLENLYSLFQNVEQDFKTVDAWLDNTPRRLFHGVYFLSLLQDIQKHAAADGINNSTTESYYDHLEQAIKSYVVDQNPNAVEIFATRCTPALAEIQACASTNSAILPLIAKWLATLLTLGMTVLVSSIRNKRETGRFQNRFFNTGLQDKVDKLETLVHTHFYETPYAP